MRPEFTRHWSKARCSCHDVAVAPEWALDRAAATPSGRAYQSAMESPNSRRQLNCRICGSENLRRYLNLGATPLANSYLRAEDLASEEFREELALQVCLACGLSQLTVVVTPLNADSDTLKEAVVVPLFPSMTLMPVMDRLGMASLLAIVAVL